MPIIEKNISLAVAAEAAFRYLSNPAHLIEFCPNMIEISDVSRHVQGKTKFVWAYKMMDVRLIGEAEITETKHNQQLNLDFSGGVQGRLIWKLQPAAGEIRLEVEVDYALPAPLLKKHPQRVLLIQNEQDAERMLTNLKSVLEAQNVMAVS